MVKLWISDKLELRWNEWPEKPLISAAHIYEDQIEAYDKSLAKAKAESILVDDLRIKMVVMKDAKRDTFVEYPGEMEVVDQFSDGHTWFDIAKLNADNLVVIGGKRRKVARLKSVNSAHGYSEGAEFSSDSTKVFPAGTGMWFPEKQIEDLKSKLDAANKRIKELEEIFEEEWRRSSECKPIMNMAVEVFIPEEDNHVTVGMWDISKKWVLLDEYRTPQSEVTYWRKLRPEPKDRSFNPTEDYDERTMKARILEAFNSRWMAGEMNSGKARRVISEVLDELGIK